MADGDTKRIPLVGNAPADWPPLHLLGIAVRKGLAAEAVARSLRRGFRRSGRGSVTIELNARYMIADGVLSSSFAVIEGGVRTPVYIFQDDLSGAAARFAWATDALAAAGYPRPIYLAPAALPSSAPGPVTLKWGTYAAFPARRGHLRRGLHAMWWGASANPDVEPGLRDLRRAYASMVGFESAVLLRFASLRLVDRGAVDRMMRGEPVLEERERVVPVSLPDGHKGGLCLSREKGIRFLFNVEATPPGFRDRFLHQFANFVEGIRRDYASEGKAPPDRTASQGAMWWAGMDQVMRQGALGGSGGQNVIGGFDL